MGRLPPLLEEFLVAGALMACLAVGFALGFWLVTGISPWPYIVLAEVAGFGWGTTMLAIGSPHREVDARLPRNGRGKS